MQIIQFLKIWFFFLRQCFWRSISCTSSTLLQSGKMCVQLKTSPILLANSNEFSKLRAGARPVLGCQCSRGQCGNELKIVLFYLEPRKCACWSLSGHLTAQQLFLFLCCIACLIQVCTWIVQEEHKWHSSPPHRHASTTLLFCAVSRAM